MILFCQCVQFWVIKTGNTSSMKKKKIKKLVKRLETMYDLDKCQQLEELLTIAKEIEHYYKDTTHRLKEIRRLTNIQS